MAETTVVIVARNAEATLGRALDSALREPIDHVLIVDDASTDATAEVGRSRLDRRVSVVTLETHTTVGAARQATLDRVRSAVGIWLDADDEMLPGRAGRLVEALLGEQAELVADGAELVRHDGVCQDTPIPEFMWRPPGPLRLFERNYLPAPGAIGFRRAALARLGYDRSLHGAEDVDILLRALADGMRIALVPTAGYRVHATPGSLSRGVTRQRAMYRRALEKHSYERVEALWIAAGATERQVAWALVSMALFREDLGVAAAAVERVAALTGDGPVVSEPFGPCQRRDDWRMAFTRGTLAWLDGSPARAVPYLEAALALFPAPDVLNNLGAALFGCGEVARARDCFAEALVHLPGYADARHNLDLVPGGSPRFTTHPLRESAVRADYPTERAATA